MTITNDGATILKQLDVEHPAAKVLVELADLQDQEVCIVRILRFGSDMTLDKNAVSAGGRRFVDP